VVSQPRPPAPARPARRLEPQPYAGEAPRRATAAQPERRRSGRGARRALLGLFVGLLFAVAVVVALVIATSTSNSVVNFRTTVAHDAQSAFNQFQNLVSQYTK
jgi:hypothetical protein